MDYYYKHLQEMADPARAQMEAMANMYGTDAYWKWQHSQHSYEMYSRWLHDYIEGLQLPKEYQITEATNHAISWMNARAAEPDSYWDWIRRDVG